LVLNILYSGPHPLKDARRIFSGQVASFCTGGVIAIRICSPAAESNVAQAQHLARLVQSEPATLELVAPVTLNIVCFRYIGGATASAGNDAERGNSRQCAELDAINKEILLRIQERGVAMPSSTVLNGKFCVRVCITNHRTRFEDMDMICKAVKVIGGEVVRERSATAPIGDR
jgi:glutamate/tyrosine decarboxylase-like PLP-dependent enzyme